jgi:hypothetical protein
MAPASRSSVSPKLAQAAAILASVATLALLGCQGDERTAPTFPGSGGNGVSAPISISCSPSSTTVLAGAAPLVVTARATYGTSAAPGETVLFTVTRGTVTPDAVVTDASGFATAFYTPPASAGSAILNTTVTSRVTGVTVTSACSITVREPGDPRVTVSLLLPDQAAGVSLTLSYDPDDARLTQNGARALGVFSNCSTEVNDEVGIGRLRFVIGCTTLRSPAGPVASFDFSNISNADLDASDFFLSCTAVDEQGRQLATACSTSVILL